jgi:cobyrinic acid a,c-diamide synthase
MVGSLPLEFVLEKRPQGHGYTVLEVDRENPFYPEGETLKGHEFHYSRPIVVGSRDLVTIFRVHRGRGLDGQRDGLCHKNLLATYSHMHAGGSPLWAEGLFKAALRRRKEKAEFFDARSK